MPVCVGLEIIGDPARNHPIIADFRLTLGEIIGRIWLTLDDPWLAINETSLQSSAQKEGQIAVPGLGDCT